jgi:D-amino-acid dehydrogenase
MRVCILGAGVIGLTTAWELLQRGYEVTVVDRNRDPGAEASFANGAQLSYSYVAPLASPETLRMLPRLLLSHPAAIRIRPTYDPELIRWSWSFLAACSTRMVEETTRAQLALAALSRGVLAELAEGQALFFSLRTAGKLVLHRKGKSLDAAKRQVERQNAGGGQEVLSPADCLAMEPSLKLREAEVAGGIYTASEQVGDCRLFCEELADRLRRHGSVCWQLGTHVRGLVVRDGRVRALDTSQGQFATDRVVLALGAEAPRFARQADFRLPIYPMKGYSITARLAPGAEPLRHSVTDFDRRVVYATLCENGSAVVRMAGIADLVGFDRRVDAKRLATMTRQAADTLALDLESDIRPWAGLRPATPNSRPIIGWSPLPNLFLNTGHGALGWTLACGSARLAAEIITASPPSVRPDWFSLGGQT